MNKKSKICIYKLNIINFKAKINYRKKKSNLKKIFNKKLKLKKV